MIEIVSFASRAKNKNIFCFVLIITIAINNDDKININSQKA